MRSEFKYMLVSDSNTVYDRIFLPLMQWYVLTHNICLHCSVPAVRNNQFRKRKTHVLIQSDLWMQRPYEMYSMQFSELNHALAAFSEMLDLTEWIYNILRQRCKYNINSRCRKKSFFIEVSAGAYKRKWQGKYCINIRNDCLIVRRPNIEYNSIEYFWAR